LHSPTAAAELSEQLRALLVVERLSHSSVEADAVLAPEPMQGRGQTAQPLVHLEASEVTQEREDLDSDFNLIGYKVQIRWCLSAREPRLQVNLQPVAEPQSGDPHLQSGRRQLLGTSSVLDRVPKRRHTGGVRQHREFNRQVEQRERAGKTPAGGADLRRWSVLFPSVGPAAAKFALKHVDSPPRRVVQLR
jgi:hypothetical protein